MSPKTLLERKKRWQGFYDVRRPARHMFLIRFSENERERPWPNPDKKQDRVEWAWEQYLNQTRRAAWLDDDVIPHLDVYTGTEIFAEAFGCRVHRPPDNMPFALPLISRSSQVAALRVPDLDAPSLRILFEIADALQARAGPDAVLKMADIQSPMDIAALIWEKSAFYTAFLETPEAVRELAHKVYQLVTRFLDEWFSRYGRDFVAHYPDYYMPRGITLSEDEIGAVNPQTFEEFFLPELLPLSERYGGIGIHCCANARHQWAGLTRIPGLRLLNLVQPPDVLREAYHYFASAAPQMHSWCGDGHPLSWIERLPAGSRVVLQVSAESRAQAVELSRQLRTVLEDGGKRIPQSAYSSAPLMACAPRHTGSRKDH